MRARRHVRQPPDLTSLFDVLFIVIFAALIRAAAVQQSAEAAKPKPPEPVTPVKLDPSSLRARALADLSADIAARTPTIVRIAQRGAITEIESDGKASALDTPLVEPSTNPRVRLKYLGDRSAELRICRIVAVHLGVPDLTKHVVIIAPEVPLDALDDVLAIGLKEDIKRCLSEQRGISTIVDPNPPVKP